MNCLEDIASNIQIQSDFCICHPEYETLELSSELRERFQQLSEEVRYKYLSVQLRNFIYNIYFKGDRSTSSTSEKSSISSSLDPNLENNSLWGQNLSFYEPLHNSNSGQGYFDPDWLVLREEGDRDLVVQKDGLTLHAQRQRHLQRQEQLAKVGELIAIQMPRNSLEQGFYVAVSNVGLVDRNSEAVYIYFNFSSAGAIALMKDITDRLNQIEIAFTFKVLSDPSDYWRYDSGVLYFERDNYELVRSMLETVYRENRSHFEEVVPIFTKLLAPGLGLAEVPVIQHNNQDKFGMHRCQIVADGLLEAWKKGKESPGDRTNEICQHFSRLKLQWQHPYLNAKSKDIYSPLELSK
ncbi:MAG: hypothetical protein KME17_24995 [Cyanosarcina radialis HA8281-LM2]|jgi:hypothetical protein|nr:hypothetical protein [Cyanosarcina radialis HA8281-LM2]